MGTVKFKTWIKGIVCFTSISLILLASLAGCSSKPPTITTITLWHYYGAGIKSQFDALVQQFNETVGKEKGIIVDAYAHGGVNELASAVIAAAKKDVGASPMPNIFSLYSDSAFLLDNMGVIASLDSYFTPDELAKYRKEFIDNGRIDTQKNLKIMPVAKSTELLFINKTAFDEFSEATGVKVDDLATWEGLNRTAEKFYEWSEGNALFGIDSLSNFIITGTKQLGQSLFEVKDNAVQCNLTPEIARKLWDNYYVPYMKGYFASKGRFRSDDLKSGMIIMFTGSTSSASFFPKEITTSKASSYKIESLVLPFPHFEKGGKFAIEQGAGMLVSKTDPATEKACVEFLKWFTDVQQNQKFAVSTSYIPVKNDAMSFEATVQALGTSDPSDIKVQAAKTTYDMLADYSLYATPPFDKSAEARELINAALMSYSQNQLKALEEQVASGKDRAELIAGYTSDDAFNTWYNDLMTNINKLIAK